MWKLIIHSITEHENCIKQVNLFKKGLGVGVPGNQHEKIHMHRERSKIQRQILVLIFRGAGIFPRDKLFFFSLFAQQVIFFKSKLLQVFHFF